MNRPRAWLMRLLGMRVYPDSEGSGEDVAVDPGPASSRATGGDHDELSGDRGSTTGTGRNAEFVGRVAGDDIGYAGETGAERRAEAEALREHSDRP
jgi:hypothetical protein